MNVVPAMHNKGPHTPTLPFVPQGATREKAAEEKDRDTHQGGGREKVHAREKCEQRKGKRATKPRKKSGVASFRARDVRSEGGTADTRQTAGTTLHRSTGEGSTRGIREKRHHAPRHAPHRHHTHRTHPQPRPQHVASEPRQPAQRAGSWEEGAPEPRRPLPPPWRAAPNRARGPRGRCKAPTPAHLRPQHVGSGPRQPVQRAGSWGRGSA